MGSGGSLNYAVANSVLTFGGGQLRSLATFNNDAVEGRVSFGAAPAQQESYRTAIASYEALVADQIQKKEELRKQAEEDGKNYEALKK